MDNISNRNGESEYKFVDSSLTERQTVTVIFKTLFSILFAETLTGMRRKRRIFQYLFSDNFQNIIVGHFDSLSLNDFGE